MPLTLPREIRDNIYELLLCNYSVPPLARGGFQTQSDTIIYLEHHRIQPQILRLNRQIHDEATHLMLRKNLFVKVNTELALAQRIVAQKQLPILKMGPQRNIDRFKKHVMEHAIIDVESVDDSDGVNSDSELTWSFVFLHRDIEIFCQIIEYLKGIIPDYDNRLVQRVVLVDPFPKAFIKNKNRSERSMWQPQSFYSETLAEQLISPYRKAFKGSGLRMSGHDAIHEADELLPGDPGIEEEKARILEWAASLGVRLQ